MQKTANPHVVKVSVIVPYFQNDEGILKSVVQSAFNQLGDIDYEVIVVDDESPVPAEMELSLSLIHI